MAATKPDPIIVSFWRYIKHLFFSSVLTVSTSLDETAETISTVEAVLPSTPHKVLIPTKLIENLEYLYLHGDATYERLSRYQADVNYFIEILDNYNGAELGRFMSQINELDALINLSIGNQAQAQADLSDALALNPEGTWLVSSVAKKWESNAATTVQNANPNHVTMTRQSNEDVVFRNTWTEEINGWGYSKNSKFNKLRQRVFERDNFKCIWCASRVNLTVDHILELSLGGTNELNNLRTLCKDCHEKRHAKEIFNHDFVADDDYGYSNKINTKLGTLIRQAETGEGTSIEYTDRDEVKSIRVIHPLRIYKNKYIYVNAYCELDKGERTFRLSRMRLTENRENEYLNMTKPHIAREWRGTEAFNTEAGRTIYSRKFR